MNSMAQILRRSPALSSKCLANPQIWCCRTNQTLPVAHKLFNLSAMTNFQSLRPLRQYSTELPHMGPRSFSEMRDAALSFRKRMYRITLYLGAGFFFIVLPVSTLAAQAWEQRHWPMLQAKIISIVPVEGNKRSVTYRYKVLGRVVEKTQVNWDYPLWDRINNTAVDYKEGDFVPIHHHPQNITLSILHPGRFAHLDFGRLKGNVVEDTTRPGRPKRPANKEVANA